MIMSVHFESEKLLNYLFFSPDMVVCRSGEPLSEATKQKISDFCHVHPDVSIAINIGHYPSKFNRIRFNFLARYWCSRCVEHL
jgi:CTP synthase (UTP-ammonia lyase)